MTCAHRQYELDASEHAVSFSKEQSIYNFTTHLPFLCQRFIKIFRCQWAFGWSLGSVYLWQRHVCPIFLFGGQGDVSIIAWYWAQGFAIWVCHSSGLLGFAQPHRGAAWRGQVAVHDRCCWSMRHEYMLACFVWEKCCASMLLGRCNLAKYLKPYSLAALCRPASRL
jgi:hypothetical protein